MNSCHRVLLWFFVIVVLHAIRVAVGEYDPLFFFQENEDYSIIYNVTYDSSKAQYIVKAPNTYVFVACPSLDENSDFFEVRKIEPSEAAVLPLCEKPIQSRIFQPITRDEIKEEVQTIGFLIQKPSKQMIYDLIKSRKEASPGQSLEETSANQLIESNVTNQNQAAKLQILQLMVFKFDNTHQRIKFVWHDIGAGKLLTPEISHKSDEPYQANRDYFDYDVDYLYAQASGPYVKVQLTPEDDFLFENWKSASRQNLLTAPMRRELLPQWQQLEIFIRKVAQIIDAVAVMTGIHGSVLEFDQEALLKPVYLHDEKHEIPGLFWKVVAIEFDHEDTRYSFGILFVMHNVNPYANPQIDKICPDDKLSHTGWKFPADEAFQKFMYPCLWNMSNMRAFEEYGYDGNGVFDLNKVPTKRIDERGKEIFESINVIEKMNENDGGILNNIVRYFIDAFSYVFTFLPSYYHNYNKNK